MTRLLVLMIIVCACIAGRAPGQDLMTPWGEAVDPDNPLPEHPRPQMFRPSWTNLNGRWNAAIVHADAPQPTEWPLQLTVPFPIESALSGVRRRVGPDEALWCGTPFRRPSLRPGQRVLLHFGAVDWRATVWINRIEIGTHEGGYDPFTFDITDAINDERLQEVVVRVWDPTDAGPQPRGKQVREPGGIWYTPVTGIWQTVWLEIVGPTSVDSLDVNTDVDASRVEIGTIVRGQSGGVEVRARVYDGAAMIAEGAAPAGSPVALDVPDAKLWSPDSPSLYTLRVSLLRNGREIDTVNSYFAMRKIEVRADEGGINRLFLNNEPIFMFGPLDQGWWPDGLYTAPSDDALKWDIETTRRLGFNMCRKHVKVEPARWYYWCDRLGLMVWQDMPSGDTYIGPGDPDHERSPESEGIFRREWSAVMRSLDHFACIVAWVPFNEGWGQFKTAEILGWTKQQDPTRLVDGPSGWADRNAGDMHDMHAYPGPGMFPVEHGRASVLGEFGGLGLAVPGHLWQEDRNWGYRSFDDAGALTEAYLGLVERLRPLIARGLAAAVYTQTTDVEIEVNGLATYDRRVVKMDEERVREANLSVLGTPPIVRDLLHTSEGDAQLWEYTFDPPGQGWLSGDDRGSWERGPGGFGRAGTPGAVIGTAWETSEIWIRRGFDLDAVPAGTLMLRVHHDEDVQVFINGVQVLQRAGYTTSYLDLADDEALRRALRPGKNVIAAHCRQTGGGQFLDVGISVITERE